MLPIRLTLDRSGWIVTFAILFCVFADAALIAWLIPIPNEFKRGPGSE